MRRSNRCTRSAKIARFFLEQFYDFIDGGWYIDSAETVSCITDLSWIEIKYTMLYHVTLYSVKSSVRSSLYSIVFECRFPHFFLVRVRLRWFVKILGHLSIRYALYKIFYNLIITTHMLFYWYNLKVISKKLENVYRNYKIFIGNIYLIKN